MLLIDSVLEDNRDKKADSLIMPILFLIDQSIELYMKTVICLLEERVGDKPSKYRIHDISELNNIMVSKIKKIENKTVGLKRHLTPVTDYIEELYDKLREKNSTSKKVE